MSVVSDEKKQAEREQVFVAVKMQYGFVPNVIRELAVSPAAARVYIEGQRIMAGAALTAREQQAVSLAVSRHNGCAYCRAAHRAGGRHAGLSEADIAAIDSGGIPGAASIAGVVAAARRVLSARGWLAAADLSRFEALGMDRARLYEIVALIGLKTITNYVNHIAHTEIDAPLRDAAAEAERR